MDPARAQGPEFVHERDYLFERMEATRTVDDEWGRHIEAFLESLDTSKN